MDRRTLHAFYNNLFNPKFAIISGVFNGAIVLVMNVHHDAGVMLAAGCAQALSSFVSTGITARIVQHFSPLTSMFWSYAGGSVVPAFLTLAMALSAHALNATPRIVLSSLPAAIISFGTSFVTNWMTRRGYFRPKNYPTNRS